MNDMWVPARNENVQYNVTSVACMTYRIFPHYLVSSIADTEDNLQRAVYLLYKISKEYNLEIRV